MKLSKSVMQDVEQNYWAKKRVSPIERDKSAATSRMNESLHLVCQKLQRKNLFTQATEVT
jgi:hypothetical protein